MWIGFHMRIQRFEGNQVLGIEALLPSGKR
jgi:hypothetical protein